MRIVGPTPEPTEIARSHFLEEISRDARTAMAVILGYSEMLAEEVRTTNPELIADIDRIRDAGTMMEERVEHEGLKASVDELTGVHNRRFIMAQGKMAIKAVNDNHGHLVGDQVLCAVSWRCQQALREIDHLTRPSD